MESESSSEMPRIEGRGRKWVRCVEEWVKNKKIRKDSGKAYTTYHGELKRCKRQVALTCHCQHHCSSHVTMEDRQRIFDDFYQLGSHDTQNKYIYGLIERCVPKQRRLRQSAGKQRSNTYCYFVQNVKGERIQVCKVAFCQLHGIGKRRVEIFTSKLASGVLISGDNCGTHASRPHAIRDETKAKHIESFPAWESHYSCKIIKSASICLKA